MNFEEIDRKICKIINKNNLSVNYDGDYSTLDGKELGFTFFHDMYEILSDEFVNEVYLIGREIAKEYEFAKIQIEMDLYPLNETNELKASLVIKQN